MLHIWISCCQQNHRVKKKHEICSNPLWPDQLAHILLLLEPIPRYNDVPCSSNLVTWGGAKSLSTAQAFLRLQNGERVLAHKHASMFTVVSVYACAFSSPEQCQVSSVSWIAFPVYTDEKINFPTNRQSYNKSKTMHKKLSARRIQIYWVYFVWSIFDHFFQNNFANNVWKNRPGIIGFTSLNSLVPRSQVHLRSLRSLEYWFFSFLRTSSCWCAHAQ